jgi:hypothetical protein
MYNYEKNVILASQTLNYINPNSLFMANRFSEVRDLIHGLEADFQKFYDKGNKAAGTRVRKGMQDLKNLAQDIRLGVQKSKNSESTGGKKSGAAKGKR